MSAGTVGVEPGPFAGLALLATPNPSRSAQALEFTLPTAGAVRIEFHHVAGRIVRTFVPGTLPAGPHRIRAHNTLFSKTHDVVLQPGEHARFVAINRAGWGTFGLLMFLGAAPVYLTFERARE